MGRENTERPNWVVEEAAMEGKALWLSQTSSNGGRALEGCFHLSSPASVGKGDLILSDFISYQLYIFMKTSVPLSVSQALT